MLAPTSVLMITEVYDKTALLLSDKMSVAETIFLLKYKLT